METLNDPTAAEWFDVVCHFVSCNQILASRTDEMRANSVVWALSPEVTTYQDEFPQTPHSLLSAQPCIASEEHPTGFGPSKSLQELCARS